MQADKSILASFSGATVRRIVDPSHSVIPEHAHDWPVLSLYVCGSYRNRSGAGELRLHRPSAIFYGAGSHHSNDVEEFGFEQIEIEFDPDWLGQVALPQLPTSRWTGGIIAWVSRTLALACASKVDERTLKSALIGFFDEAAAEKRQPEPSWLSRVDLQLASSPALTVQQLAADIGRHPFWVGNAYKRATGESLQHATARLRVQRAAKLLRETSDNAASIAVDCGFCDQSHMIRTFRRVLGRTPQDVREDPMRTFRKPQRKRTDTRPAH